MFEGVVGTSYTGDIALDDISFSSDCVPVNVPTPTPSVGPCGANKFQCTGLAGSKVCLDISKKCDFSRDCSDGSDEGTATCGYPCDFAKDTCAWTDSVADNFDWKRHKGCTGSISTGPCTDADNNKQGKQGISH